MGRSSFVSVVVAVFGSGARSRLLVTTPLVLVGFALLVPAACSSDPPGDDPILDAATDDAWRSSDATDAPRDVMTDGAIDAAWDATRDASTDSSDAGDGTYHQGIYLCCGEGQGRSCCPPDTLPDPDAGRLAMCFQYGGTRGKCTALGEQLEAKDICSICCPGLTRVPSLAPAPGGPIRVGNTDCAPTAPPSVFGCTACGDGVCGAEESECNCPGDCGDGGVDASVEAGDAAIPSTPDGGPTPPEAGAPSPPPQR